jgi:hypothetical protein
MRAYAFALLVCVLALVIMVVFVSEQCGQIYAEDGGAYDCGVGVGWLALAGAFVVAAGYAGYRLWGVWRGI